MPNLIFAVAMLLSGLTADCDADLRECREHCSQTHNPHCLVDCYNKYNECKFSR